MHCDHNQHMLVDALDALANRPGMIPMNKRAAVMEWVDRITQQEANLPRRWPSDSGMISWLKACSRGCGAWSAPQSAWISCRMGRTNDGD